jgi:glucose-6-phosphate-specific signal transduction histidine kinase
MLGVYLISSAPIVHVTPLETPFGLVIPFITIVITRNYNHTQLFLTRLRVYTVIILTRSWLQSLSPLLHVDTVYMHYTLIFTALLHLRSPNLLCAFSLADFSAIGHHWLSHTVAHAKFSIHCEPTHFLELTSSQSLWELNWTELNCRLLRAPLINP